MIDHWAAVLVALAFAGGLEAILGEPPGKFHPVALLGRLIGWLESNRFGVPTLTGVVYALAIPLACAVAAYAAVQLASGTLLPLLGVFVAGLVLWISSSVRLLLESGRTVVEASDDDPETARTALLALVGRETDDLSPGLVRSAAIESLAENLADGLVAPLGAFVALSFVSLPAAAAGAAFVKGANTMDSMLGYPGAFGWGSARLDDLVMFVPARISALLVALAAGEPDALGRARRYVHKPASPNAGWPMGTIAAGLNVRLEKPGVYVLNEVADLPTVADGRDAISLVRRSAALAYAVALGVGVIGWV